MGGAEKKSSMTTTYVIIGAILLIAFLGVGGYFLFRKKDNGSSEALAIQSPSSATATTPTTAPIFSPLPPPAGSVPMNTPVALLPTTPSTYYITSGVYTLESFEASNAMYLAEPRWSYMGNSPDEYSGITVGPNGSISCAVSVGASSQMQTYTLVWDGSRVLWATAANMQGANPALYPIQVQPLTSMLVQTQLYGLYSTLVAGNPTLQAFITSLINLIDKPPFSTVSSLAGICVLSATIPPAAVNATSTQIFFSCRLAADTADELQPIPPMSIPDQLSAIKGMFATSGERVSADTECTDPSTKIQSGTVLVPAPPNSLPLCQILPTSAYGKTTVWDNIRTRTFTLADIMSNPDGYAALGMSSLIDATENTMVLGLAAGNMMFLNEQSSMLFGSYVANAQSGQTVPVLVSPLETMALLNSTLHNLTVFASIQNPTGDLATVAYLNTIAQKNSNLNLTVSPTAIALFTAFHLPTTTTTPDDATALLGEDLSRYRILTNTKTGAKKVVYECQTGQLWQIKSRGHDRVVSNAHHVSMHAVKSVASDIMSLF